LFVQVVEEEGRQRGAVFAELLMRMAGDDRESMRARIAELQYRVEGRKRKEGKVRSKRMRRKETRASARRQTARFWTDDRRQQLQQWKQCGYGCYSRLEA
jgi:hypothetical protein